MLQTKNSKFIKIFSATFLLSLYFFFISQSKNDPASMAIENYLVTPISEGVRNLFGQAEMEDLCSKAKGSLRKKYESDNIDKKDRTVDLDKYEETIVDIIKDSSWDNIKEYLPKLVVFMIYIVLFVLFIFAWIVYCVCCCCPCCCCKKTESDTEGSLCRRVLFIITAVMYLILIITSIIGLALKNKIIKSINGTACAASKAILHFTDGTNGDFPSVKQWKGKDAILRTIDNTISKADDIQDLANLTYIKGALDPQKPLIDNNDLYKGHYALFSESYNLIQQGSDLNFTEPLNDARDTVEDISESIEDVKNDELDDIYDAIDDYAEKYTKLFFNVYFAVSLVLGILGLGSLCVYVFLKCQCIRILFHFVWNFQMFFLMLGILVGSVFGIVGSVGSDMVNVVKYAVSTENLRDPDPIIFDFSEENVDYIDVCLNGDGKLGDKLFNDPNKNDTSKAFNYINDFHLLTETLKQKQAELQSYKDNSQKPTGYDNNINQLLIDGYQEEIKKDDLLYDCFQELLGERSNSFYDVVDCEFLGKDVDIIIDEVDSTIGKNFTSVSVTMLLGCTASVIGVMLGIIVIHKYRILDEPEKPPEENQNTAQTHNDATDQNISTKNLNTEIPPAKDGKIEIANEGKVDNPQDENKK